MTMVWTPCYFWLAPLPPLPNNAVTLTLMTTLTLSNSPNSDAPPLQLMLSNQASMEGEFVLFFFVQEMSHSLLSSPGKFSSTVFDSS